MRKPYKTLSFHLTLILELLHPPELHRNSKFRAYESKPVRYNSKTGRCDYRFLHPDSKLGQTNSAQGRCENEFLRSDRKAKQSGSKCKRSTIKVR